MGCRLEEYRYSRLSQSELEVDSVIFSGDQIRQHDLAVQQHTDEDDSV